MQFPRPGSYLRGPPLGAGGPCGLCRPFPPGTAYSSSRGTRMTSHLSWRDIALALAVVLVWGTNFVVIRLGLNALPPLFFATLRFVFVFAPAALFLPKPKVTWSNLAIYGLCIGLIQFGLLFIAMNGHISPGLASLVVQMQVFFTIGLSMLRSGERIKPHQMAAFALAIAGMGVIAV